MNNDCFRKTMLCFENSQEKHNRIFSNCVDERYADITYDITIMLQFVFDTYGYSIAECLDSSDASVNTLSERDIIESASIILFSILKVACSKVRKIKRKKYAETAIKNYYQIVSFLIYYSDSIGSDYSYILPNTYLKDMFGITCTDENIKLISDPIEYLKKYNEFENTTDKKIWKYDAMVAININAIQMNFGQAENLYEIYKSAYKKYFYTINNFVLEKMQEINIHIREFCDRLEEDYFDIFNLIKNSGKSYISFILRRIYKHSKDPLSFKNIRETCDIIVNHDYSNRYDDSKPMYLGITGNSYFIRDLMYLYRECAELLYYTDYYRTSPLYPNSVLRGLDIVVKIKRYGKDIESVYEKDSYSCLIYMYIWFKQRFKITLSDEVIRKILYSDNEYNKALNSLIYISYLLNENSMFVKNEYIEKKVNDFFLEIVYK